MNNLLSQNKTLPASVIAAICLCNPGYLLGQASRAMEQKPRYVPPSQRTKFDPSKDLREDRTPPPLPEVSYHQWWDLSIQAIKEIDGSCGIANSQPALRTALEKIGWKPERDQFPKIDWAAGQTAVVLNLSSRYNRRFWRGDIQLFKDDLFVKFSDTEGYPVKNRVVAVSFSASLAGLPYIVKKCTEDMKFSGSGGGGASAKGRGGAGAASASGAGGVHTQIRPVDKATRPVDRYK